jgi:Casjensviridae endonuclease
MKPNPDPLEKVIERKVCDHAKALGCYVRKFTSPSHASVPDRMFITPNGVVFFVEMKRKGKEPTAAQAIEIQKIRSKNVRVFVVDEVQNGKNVVDGMVALLKEPLF